jgi:hypothetical protein
MNCLDFRRAIGSDPRGLSGEAHTHKAACPRCADAHERALAFERTLGAAIALPVPEGLAERILLRQTTSAIHEPGTRKFAIWQIAAGVLLMIGLAVTFGPRLLMPSTSLQSLAVAHLGHEPLALSSRAEVPALEVRAMFAALGAPLARSPFAVHYLNDCPLGSDVAVHMVLQRASGPVTAMFVPGRRGLRRDFERAGVRGRESPTGDGVLILLAANARDFDTIESGFQRAFSASSSDAVGAP